MTPTLGAVADAQVMMNQYDLTVYHDGSCPLCRLEIGHYRAQPGSERIAFIDVSDPQAVPGADLTRHEALRRFHVRLPSGELKSGASAFVEIWKLLPRWKLPAGLASLPGAAPAMDAGYRLLSPFRPVLARLIGRFGSFSYGPK